MAERTRERKTAKKAERKTRSTTRRAARDTKHAARDTRRTAHSTRRGSNDVGRAIEHRVQETEEVLKDIGHNLGGGTRRKTTRRK